MITIAIIAILTLIATPLYTHYVKKSHRAEATAELSAIALAQENYKLKNGHYSDSLSTLWQASSENGYYNLSMSLLNDAGGVSSDAETATGFKITADPTDSQADDSECDPIELTFNNAIVDKIPKDCWR